MEIRASESGPVLFSHEIPPLVVVLSRMGGPVVQSFTILRIQDGFCFYYWTDSSILRERKGKGAHQQRGNNTKNMVWEKIQTETSFRHTLLISSLLPRCSQPALLQLCTCRCAAKVGPRGVTQQPAPHTCHQRCLGTALVAMPISPCVPLADGALQASAENQEPQFTSKLLPHSLFIRSKHRTLLFPATSPHFNHLQQSKSIIYMTYYLLHPTHS